jgi:uncharacterized protein YndB with AHSA1/START domain
MTQTKLQITTPSERELRWSRVFDAPRARVFAAISTPELVRRWLLGPPGWAMPVCEIDLRAGGVYRYVWRNEQDGKEMGVGGVYREIVVPERIVASERFDEAWYPGEAQVTMELLERSGKTTLIQTMQYESEVARAAVLRTGFEAGIEASFERLASTVVGL